jgi:hypothetical protein
MMLPRFRIASFIILLWSLLCFSGVAQAGLLLADPVDVQDSCCRPESDQNSDKPVAPCVSPECLCTGCSAALIQVRFDCNRFFEESTLNIPHYIEVLSSGFNTRIDYPPEAA